jgi:hypothetical protein
MKGMFVREAGGCWWFVREACMLFVREKLVYEVCIVHKDGRGCDCCYGMYVAMEEGMYVVAVRIVEKGGTVVMMCCSKM